MQRLTILNASAARSSRLIAVLIVVALTSFALTSCERGAPGNSALQTVRIATGEWEPYSGEDLPEFGIASAIVTAVLKNAGYKPDYEFMPWKLVEEFAQNNETNNGIRGTFPYLSTEQRRELFYYSGPLLSIDHSLYFNEDRFSLALNPVFAEKNLSAKEKLRQLKGQLKKQTFERLEEEFETSTTDEEVSVFMNTAQLVVWLETLELAIVPIKGYGVKKSLEPYLSKIEPVDDTLAAFNLLKSSDSKLVVLEASAVGDKILSDKFPGNNQNQPDQMPGSTDKSSDNNIISAPIRIPQYVHFIVGKRNPHNQELIDKFNDALASLKTTGTLKKIESRTSGIIGNRNLIRLHSFRQDHYITGEKIDEQGKYVIILNGTKARILEWNTSLLDEHDSEPGSEQNYKVKIKIEQGPHTGTIVLIDSRSIVIP